MGGLKQKSPDYNWIWSKFLDPEDDAYDIENYNADDIWKDPSREFFKNKDYDLKQFKLSLGRLVKKIREGINSPPAGEHNAPADDQQPEAPPPTQSGKPNLQSPSRNPKQAPASAGKKTPSTKTPASTAPKERVVNDEIPMALPYHMWNWKDNDNNDRLTCMILLPVGTTKDMVSPRITSGGDEIKVEYIWPNAMLDVKVPMFMGSQSTEPFYDKGHIKVAHFRDSVKLLKRGDDKKQVKSIFRVDTLFTVEEQFTALEVPSPVSIVKFPVQGSSGTPTQAKCLVLEMMGVRDNYKSVDGSIDEFICDMGNLTI
jgi:hypothetical protein